MEAFAKKTIDRKFLESSHSFLSCNSDFGDIDRVARSRTVIYVPVKWLKLVVSAQMKQPFNAVRMNVDQFGSTAGLELAVVHVHVNRKKD